MSRPNDMNVTESPTMFVNNMCENQLARLHNHTSVKIAPGYTVATSLPHRYIKPVIEPNIGAFVMTSVGEHPLPVKLDN